MLLSGSMITEFSRLELDQIDVWLRARSSQEEQPKWTGPTTASLKAKNKVARQEERKVAVRNTLSWREHHRRKYRLYMRLLMRARRAALKNFSTSG